MDKIIVRMVHFTDLQLKQDAENEMLYQLCSYQFWDLIRDFRRKHLSRL